MMDTIDGLRGDKKLQVTFLLLILSTLACSLFAPSETSVTMPFFPVTPLSAPTRHSGTPTPNPFVIAPYNACHSQRHSPLDFNLFPAAACPNENCVAAGLEADAYAAWKTEMMHTFDLDEFSFAEHIEIADVSATQRSDGVVITINFVVVNQWARTYQTHYISLKAEPDSDALTAAVRVPIFADTQIDLPKVASVETIAAAFDACNPELEINWCYLDYPNFGGRLYVTAFQIIDWEADQCMDAAVYVDTGELWYCRERPCMIDE